MKIKLLILDISPFSPLKLTKQLIKLALFSIHFNNQYTIHVF